MAKRTKAKAAAERRQYIQAPVAVDRGIPCSHCGNRYDNRVTNTYPNGNRRRICGKCGLPFVSVRMAESKELQTV